MPFCGTCGAALAFSQLHCVFLNPSIAPLRLLCDCSGRVCSFAKKNLAQTPCDGSHAVAVHRGSRNMLRCPLVALVLPFLRFCCQRIVHLRFPYLMNRSERVPVVVDLRYPILVEIRSPSRPLRTTPLRFRRRSARLQNRRIRKILFCKMHVS